MYIPVVVDIVDKSVVTVGTVGSQDAVKRFFAKFVDHVSHCGFSLSDFRAFVVTGDLSDLVTDTAHGWLDFVDFDLQSLVDEVTENV